MESYLHKPSDYFEHARRDVLQCLGSVQGKSILELGAGGGYTLAHAKSSGQAQYVAGVELMRLEGTEQENPSIDEFYIQNLTDQPPNFRQKSFDVLLCPDVLEHLVDPWNVLQTNSYFLNHFLRLLFSIQIIRYITLFCKIALT
ncbi:MAG: class I SAM-dependent methyltransferase [Bacteroidota bacterium]